MEAPISDWNDDHLDCRVDEGFDRLNYILITGAIAIIVALIGFHG
jgi:hypothetical protein